MRRLSRRALFRASGLGLGSMLAGCLDIGGTPRWSMFRGRANNGAGTRLDPGGDLGIGWAQPAEDLFAVEGTVTALSSPVADDRTAYIVASLELDNGDIGLGVAALSPTSGALAWQRTLTLGHGIDPGPALPPFRAPDLLFALGGDRGVSLHPEGGSSDLEVPLPWTPSTAPGGDRFLVALGGTRLGVIDLEESRNLRWNADTLGDGTQPDNPPTVLDDRVIVPIGPELLAFRRGDGEPLWSDRLPGGNPVTAAPPLVDGFHLHLRLRTDGGPDELFALERSDRSVRWQTSLEHESNDIVPMGAYRPGQLYYPDGTDMIAVHVGNGELAWRRSVGVETRYPTVGGDHLYALGDGEVVVIDRTTGALESTVALPGPTPPGPVEAVPREETLLVSRGDRILGLRSTS